MLPKAVLSWMGRFVGIAAVVGSPLAPLVAEAAESPEVSSPKATVARPASSHGHRHKSAEKAEKKAKKRAAMRSHAEGSADAPKAAGSRCDDAEVTTERASAKNPPKQSATPLPTLAAVTSKPLVEPIALSRELVVEPKAHAAEPRRTPIVHASTHVETVRAAMHGDVTVAPARAADTSSRPERKESSKHAKPPCLHAPVNVTRGADEETLSLTKCDGSALPHAVDEMSILVHPGEPAKSAPAASGGRSPKRGRRRRRARPPTRAPKRRSRSRRSTSA